MGLMALVRPLARWAERDEQSADAFFGRFQLGKKSGKRPFFPSPLLARWPGLQQGESLIPPQKTLTQEYWAIDFVLKTVFSA